jgi:hypothetical protein
MHDKVNALIFIAKNKMKKSHDPVHDLGHILRVVDYVKKFSTEIRLTPVQRQAVILAAWWHDISRTISDSPSLILMTAVDDTISALMLWFHTIRCGLFGASVGLATKIILCKSIGTGGIFTKLLLKKENRILVDIVADADCLDMLNQKRTVAIMRLVETSRTYRYGYRMAIWWSIRTAELHVKTEVARKYLKEMLKSFIAWVNEKIIFDWHVQQFGIKWVEKTLKEVDGLLQYISSPNYKSIKAGV